jgi:hypothetical protein
VTPVLCPCGVDRVARVRVRSSAGGALEVEASPDRGSWPQSRPLFVVDLWISGEGFVAFGSSRSEDLWRSRFPWAAGDAVPPAVRGGDLVLPPRHRQAGVSSNGSMGRVRWFVGGYGSRSNPMSRLAAAPAVGAMATMCYRRCSSSPRLRRASQKTEDGDFPAAKVLLFVKAEPARVERGGSSSSARPCPAAVALVCWFLRDLIVFSVFSEACIAGSCSYQ